MTTSNQRSPIPHIIPGIMSFIMIHLARLARTALRDVLDDFWRRAGCFGGRYETLAVLLRTG
jgi:hypothetical protein